MDIKAIRSFINAHPEGVKIRMIDGVEYVVPHRDWVWFTPATDMPESRVGRFGTSFYVSVDGLGHLVNAPLVKEVLPWRGKSQRQPNRRKSA